MTSVGQSSPFAQMAKRLTEAVKTFKKADRKDKGWGSSSKFSVISPIPAGKKHSMKLPTKGKS